MPPISDRNPTAKTPRFDAAVPYSGYRWWYVDGISEDGRNSVVVIAFIGSVFSPYYYRARQRGPADPRNFCAINVGLYGPRGKTWAMTERGRGAMERGADWFRVGPSNLQWHDEHLEINIRERSAPLARRLAGKIVLRPDAINDRTFGLDALGRHQWQPFAPSARIDVQMESPALSWQGDGYFDTNAGARALEDDFRCWDWSRGKHNGGTSISYAVTERDGTERSLALSFEKCGKLSERTIPNAVSLPRSGWRIGRTARTPGSARVDRTLEDTPFYARSLLRVGDRDASRLLMHESLELDRFRSGWVRFLLPFRMPRLP